jgi:hypothetical protein
VNATPSWLWGAETGIAALLHGGIHLAILIQCDIADLVTLSSFTLKVSIITKWSKE